MSDLACGVWHREFDAKCWRCQRNSRLASDQRVAELEDFITACEWYQPTSNSSPSCPFCGNYKHEGHSTTCIVPIVAARDAGEDGER